MGWNKMNTEITREEALDLIIEEASEIIKAAIKCKRFGFEAVWKGEQHGEVLAKELGDLEGARQMVKWKYEQLVSYSWAASTKMDRYLQAREERKQRDTVPPI